MQAALFMSAKNVFDPFKTINSIIKGQNRSTWVAKNGINPKISKRF